MSARAETFRNPHRILLSVDPYGLATGDLNGDGKNDIVWIDRQYSPGISNLHVLLATANGQFISAPDLGLPFNPAVIHCIVEDVTGDKRTDVVCVASTQTTQGDTYLLAYVGAGDGTFAAPVKTKLSGQLNQAPLLITRSGDLNGDGLADVLVTPLNYSGIFPFLSDGQGGFKAGPIFQASFNDAVATVADVNGDGKLDVLWPGGPRVNLGNGDGTFSAPAQYDAGYDSTCAFGDLDGDGHLDAACTWIDNGDISGKIHLSVLHGNPDGSFNTSPIFTRIFGSGEYGYDGRPTILTPVLITDLNGDGYADIISLSGDGYCVLLGGPNATWNGPPEQFVTASWQSEVALGSYVGVSFADMNGDGIPDIVAIGPNGIYITYAQHDGTLSSAPAIELGEISTSAILVDVNGDGNLDAVSAGDKALKLSLGHGDGTFSSPQPITTTDDFGDATYAQGQVISGDFNGDGKQDLLATGNVAVYTTQNYILLGHGDGTFDPPKPITIALGKVADLNGDGLSDVYSIQHNVSTADALLVNLSHGDRTFSSLTSMLPVEPTGNGYVYGFVGPALADFRHTGKMDGAVATQNNAYLLRSRGDGTFDTNDPPLAVPGLPGLNKIAVFDIASGDFDNDGFADFAVLVQYGNGIYNSSNPTSAVWVFYGKGDGSFSIPVLAGTFNRDAQTLTAGDLDGDGRADLVLTAGEIYQDNGVLIVHALPNRAWGPEVDYTGGESLPAVWITDINHDGRNDLIFSNVRQLNERTNSIAVLLNADSNSVSGSLKAIPEPSNVTFPFNLQAALISSETLSGSVDFSIDGIVVGNGALVANAASFAVPGVNLPAGQHTLSASWSGDTTHPPITLSGTHKINLLPLTVILAATPVSASVGATVTATATFAPTITPNQPSFQFTGTMTLYDNGVAIAQQAASSGFSFALSSLAAGSHSLSVSYPGDQLFAAAQSNAVLVTVAGAPTVAVLSADPAAASYGTPIILLAGVSSATANSATPNGSLIFIVDGNALPSMPLINSGAARVLNHLETGTHTVSCTYSGDSTFAASTCNTMSVVISAAPSTVSITSSQNPSVAFSPVTFTIHVALNGQPAPAGSQLTFSLMNNSSNFLLTTDANGNATYTTSQLFARTWNTFALFSENNYVTSTANYPQVVTAAPTALALTASPNAAYFGQNLTFTGALTPSGMTFPTGSVIFNEGSTVLGTGVVDQNGRARFTTASLAVGNHIITATYPGDTGFQAAASGPVIVTITASDAVLTVDRPSITIQTEHHRDMSVSLASVGGLSGTFTLACDPLPTWASCNFDFSTLTLPPNSTATTTLDIDTDAVYHLKAGLQEPGLAAPPGLSRLPLLAFAPFLWFTLGLRKRWSSKQRGLTSLALAFALITMACLTGCGNKYPDHTAPGTYTVRITATAVPGSTPLPMTRTTEFTLIVTP